MNCPRCQSPVGPGATFCANCGLPLTGGPLVDPQLDQRKKQKALVIAFSVLAVLALLVGGVAMMNLFAKRGDPTLQANGTKPNSVLQLPGNAAPPTTQLTAEASPEMPQDVRDWIEHLRRCEELKRSLTVSMVAELGAFQGPASTGVGSVESVKKLIDPDAPADAGMKDGLPSATAHGMKTRFTDLSDQFRKYAPPAECAPIADSFDGGLNGLATVSGQIEEMMGSLDLTADDATQKIQNIRDSLERINRTHTSLIDDNFKDAEKGLEAIFAKYNTKPTFSIDVSGNVGGTLGAISTGH